MSPNKTLVAYPELRSLGINYTRQHIANLVKKGLFPASIKMSPRKIVWDVDELREWINTRPRVDYAPPAI